MDNNNFTNPFGNSDNTSSSSDNSTPVFGDAPSFGDDHTDTSAAPANGNTSADTVSDPTVSSANNSGDTAGFSEYRYSGSQMGGTGRETPFSGTNPYASQNQGNPYAGQHQQAPYGAQGGYGGP